MSLKTTRRTRMQVFMVGCVVALSAQSALADSGVLISEGFCNDPIPLDVVDMKWLRMTQDMRNIYYMEKDGSVQPVTADAPKFEDITRLRVTMHGSCKQVGTWPAQDFADNLATAFKDNHPDEIVLATCDGGNATTTSPAEVLAEKFSGNTRINAWDGRVGFYGSGSGKLENLRFGVSEVPNLKWEVETQKIEKNIRAKWEDMLSIDPNTSDCHGALNEAKKDPEDKGLWKFIDSTYAYYTSEDALQNGYSFLKLYSYDYGTGEVACGKGVPGNSSKDVKCSYSR